jgi:hypothetical protein
LLFATAIGNRDNPTQRMGIFREETVADTDEAMVERLEALP